MTTPSVNEPTGKGRISISQPTNFKEALKEEINDYIFAVKAVHVQPTISKPTPDQKRNIELNVIRLLNKLNLLSIDQQNEVLGAIKQPYRDTLTRNLKIIQKRDKLLENAKQGAWVTDGHNFIASKTTHGVHQFPYSKNMHELLEARRPKDKIIYESLEEQTRIPAKEDRAISPELSEVSKAAGSGIKELPMLTKKEGEDKLRGWLKENPRFKEAYLHCRDESGKDALYYLEDDKFSMNTFNEGEEEIFESNIKLLKHYNWSEVDSHYQSPTEPIRTPAKDDGKSS